MGLERPWCFVTIVPVHDEEQSLPATLASLAAARFEPQPEILVVADNCSDRTAEVAAAHGATVLVRDDPDRRGKGFALELAVATLAARAQPPDAVVFVDADTTVSRNLFEAISERLEAGA